MFNTDYPLKVFVPFVNEEMVRRFFINNPFVDRVDVRLIDNRSRNAGLPVIYNEIINEFLNEDVWLFFVHEDFEVKGSLFSTRDLPIRAVYGSFGVRLEQGIPIGIGTHTCSSKDGSNPIVVGRAVEQRAWVDTLDCQSVLLNTALLREFTKLRFDEELSFDLYAEDLCINAQTNFGVPSMVLPFDFQHYSPGRVTDRYWRGIRHLSFKYPDVGVAGPCSFIGGNIAELEARFVYDIAANPADGRRD